MIVNYRVFLALGLSIGLLAGCGRAEPKERIPFPEGMFRLSVQPILVDDWNLIYSIRIQTRGEQRASIWEGERQVGNDGVGIKTFTGVHGPYRDHTSLAECEFLIVATLVEPRDPPGYLLYRVKGRAGGFSGGGIGIYQLEEETKLEDEISIQELTGDFAEHEPIVIGRFQEKRIMLSIEAPSAPEIKGTRAQGDE